MATLEVGKRKYVENVDNYVMGSFVIWILRFHHLKVEAIKPVLTYLNLLK
jgi:hypothetical protein